MRICHGMFIQRTVLVQVHVWIDTGVCGLGHGVKNSGSATMDYTIEECSLKVREMQEPQEYAQTHVSEERRQRVNFTAFNLAAYIALNGQLSICTLIFIINTFKLYSQ